jgi:hypothetical protein
MTPRASIEAECRRVGTDRVVASCIQILSGGDVDEEILLVLAGPSAHALLRGEEGGVTGNWPRVWAMRGLLHAWDDVAANAVIEGANDASWRVREMAAKVVARRSVDGAFEAMARLKDDPVPRVKKAAERALIRLVESESS